MRAKNKAENSVVHTAFIFALEDVCWGSSAAFNFAPHSPTIRLWRLCFSTSGTAAASLLFARHRLKHGVLILPAHGFSNQLDT